MGDFELCCECDGETGRAGAGEDSLYAGDKDPYCAPCWYDLPEKFAADIVRLRAELAEARDGIELIKAEYDGWVISKCSGNPDTEQVYAQRLASAIFESARATTDRGA